MFWATCMPGNTFACSLHCHTNQPTNQCSACIKVMATANGTSDMAFAHGSKDAVVAGTGWNDPGNLLQMSQLWGVGTGPVSAPYLHQLPVLIDR